MYLHAVPSGDRTKLLPPRTHTCRARRHVRAEGGGQAEALRQGGNEGHLRSPSEGFPWPGRGVVWPQVMGQRSRYYTRSFMSSARVSPSLLSVVAMLVVGRAGGLEILSPAPGAVAFLSPDAGLEVRYTLPRQAAIKVDVSAPPAPPSAPVRAACMHDDTVRVHVTVALVHAGCGRQRCVQRMRVYGVYINVCGCGSRCLGMRIPTGGRVFAWVPVHMTTPAYCMAASHSMTSASGLCASGCAHSPQMAATP